MSWVHELAERRPDLFSEGERKRLGADNNFKKWQADIESRAQSAEDAKTRHSVPIRSDDKGPVSIPITRRLGL